jgi:hypothetical protein
MASFSFRSVMVAQTVGNESQAWAEIWRPANRGVAQGNANQWRQYLLGGKILEVVRSVPLIEVLRAPHQTSSTTDPSPHLFAPEGMAMASHYEIGIRASLKAMYCRSPMHFKFTLGLLALSCLALVPHLHAIAWVALVVADLYLLLLLWCSTRQSAGRPETFPGLPYRETAVAVLLFVFVALVMTFGALSPTPSKLRAVYDSFMSFATFSYNDTTTSDRYVGVMTAIQLTSSLLLLICAMPILISRLADYGAGSRVIIFNRCRMLLPDDRDTTVTIANGTFTWIGDKHAMSITRVGDEVDVCNATRTTVATDRTVIIESNGCCEVWRKR